MLIGKRKPASYPPRRCCPASRDGGSVRSREKVAGELRRKAVPCPVPMAAFSFRRGRNGPFVSTAPPEAGPRPGETGPAGACPGGVGGGPRGGGSGLPSASGVAEVKNGGKEKKVPAGTPSVPGLPVCSGNTGLRRGGEVWPAPAPQGEASRYLSGVPR